MNPSTQNPRGDESHLLMLGVVLLFLAMLKKYEPALTVFWAHYGPSFKLGLVLLAFAALLLGGAKLWNLFVDRQEKKAITGPDARAIFLGPTDKGEKVFLREEFRTSHTQVIGTTNAGKTESVILPWAIKDIENGSGLLIIDGKSDESFLNKLYAYVRKNNREADFRFFSLAHLGPSSTFNPLAGGPPNEVCERVFSSFPIEHPYYRVTQSRIFHALLTLLIDKGQVPTFKRVYRLIVEPATLVLWLQDYDNEANKKVLENFIRLPAADRTNQISGLEGNLSHFVHGSPAVLFNTENPLINFDEVLEKNLICYFQLPTMYYPFLAEATGKLVLQSFQNAVAKRHLGLARGRRFFSCYLDDFQDYIYPGFASLLNKSRSANVGVVFSHQALGDLDKVDPSFRNIVSTCTNIKVVMRTSDPQTCDFYAKTFGTEEAEKITERQKDGILGKVKTGEGSSREVERYIVHPKELRNLERGQGIVLISHPKGVKISKVSFEKRPDLPPVELPLIDKKPPTT